MARTLQSVDFDAVEMHMCFDQMHVLLRLMIMRLTVVVFTTILKFHAFFHPFFGYATHAIRYAGVIIALLLFNMCYFMFVCFYAHK